MHWHVRNVTEAFHRMLRLLVAQDNHVHLIDGQYRPIAIHSRQSRNGPVKQIGEPLTITYRRPWERYLLNPVRNCNPFFHLAEALWMLCGRRDVKGLDQYNASLKQFSDNGENYWGAYGYRWRHWFEHDQLAHAIERLKANPNDRRTVIAMWDVGTDGIIAASADKDYKDLPCNTHIYVQIDSGRLELTVCNRSNDVMWGMLGANAVHFSYLQEYLAICLGVKMGRLHQFTTNAHLYTDIWDDAKMERMLEHEESHTSNIPKSYVPPFLFNRATHSSDQFRLDNTLLLDNPHALPTTLNIAFTENVARPILQAWQHHKEREYTKAFIDISKCTQIDLRQNCIEWLQRAKARYISRNPYVEELQ